MPAPQIVRDLVNRFEQNLDSYHSGRYNEAQLRREFLDPFFEALGWDLFNRQGYAEAYKEVIHEDSLEIEGAAKAPDYSFRIGGTRKFFVEAKKPSVNIQSDIHPAFQLRRYTWSARLPLGILTDFEEWAVYDGLNKPDKRDKPSNGRVNYYTFRDYIERWDEIAGVFSREAVLKGSFDRFAEGMKGKRGTAEVDDVFLAEIEGWRETLARNFALRNPSLTTPELNYAVQMTIDRILFLRICEDRGIEPYEKLKGVAEGVDVYKGLCGLFRQADLRFNSGLFHFKDEKGTTHSADTLTPALSLDDKVLRPLLVNLYYPECPYVFSVISSDILGQVYEQFLGKVIRLTAGHQAKVEEKPEVRKAGGVYYTPTYIVDYIVKNTVGKLLEGKTPAEAARLKIVDPACGSGSFLLGAYQFLLDWHADWYTRHDPEKWAKGGRAELYKGMGGDWRLTTAEKKRILLNNIHGVDIDSQAVEVTKLSLLLKVLEGESGQLSLGIERALPDLGANIQCGNSLIGPDYFEGRMLVDEEERRRVNAFDWHSAFPQVFAQGGFDAVIGNPPYIRIQAMKEWAPTEVEFYKKKYIAASKGNYDIYVVFVEKGLILLNAKGRLGFILPHKFFNAQYGAPLRGLIAGGRHLAQVVHFGDQQIFENATTYTCLMFLDKDGRDFFDIEKVDNLKNWQIRKDSISGNIVSSYLTNSEWNFMVGQDVELFERLLKMPIKLGGLSKNIFQGLVTSRDPVFFLEPLSDEINGIIRVRSEETEKEYELETEVVRPLIKGSRDISRYFCKPSKRVIFPYAPRESVIAGKTILIKNDEFENKYPRTWNYLIENYDVLRNREKGKMRHGGWYGYVYPKSVTLFEKEKILTPSIAARASFTYDEFGEYYFVGSGGGGGGGYGIILGDDSNISYKYLLGLLNSNLLDLLLKKISSTFRGGYFAFSKQYIEQIPIRTIDFSDPSDKTQHDKMVALVERMLSLHKQSARTPQEQEMIRREIESTDRSIDRLVYELYGLASIKWTRLMS